VTDTDEETLVVSIKSSDITSLRIPVSQEKETIIIVENEGERVS